MYCLDTCTHTKEEGGCHGGDECGECWLQQGTAEWKNPCTFWSSPPPSCALGSLLNGVIPPSGKCGWPMMSPCPRLPVSQERLCTHMKRDVPAEAIQTGNSTACAIPTVGGIYSWDHHFEKRIKDLPPTCSCPTRKSYTIYPARWPWPNPDTVSPRNALPSKAMVEAILHISLQYRRNTHSSHAT